VTGTGYRRGYDTINHDLTTAADAFTRHGKSKVPVMIKIYVVVIFNTPYTYRKFCYCSFLQKKIYLNKGPV
jgi:hypothetical protein